ncbi:unnamed protein product, partial [Oppiella nova]
MGVSGPKPLPLFGTFLERCLNPMPHLDQSYVRKYGNIFGIFNGTDPVLLIADPELIKQVLVKDFHRFTNRRELQTEHPFINKNLFNTTDDTWKRLRTIMSSTFTSGKMRKMYPLVRQCLQEYLDHLDGVTRDGGADIDAKAMHQNFTMDVIASCAFATKTNSQYDPNNPFVVNGRNVFVFRAIKLIPAFIFPKRINKLLGIRTHLGEEPNNWICDLASHMLEKRRNGFKNNDFLQLLIDAKAGDQNNNKDANADNLEAHHVNQGEEEMLAEKSVLNGNIGAKSLTDDEIIAQSWLFLIAGFETTATTLGYISYLLALNPSAQEKLYDEVMGAVDSDGEISYEDLQRLPYLDACLSETLRLFPPLVRLERIASEDMKLGTKGVTLKKDQMIEIPVYPIHRSEKYYENPDEFKPERFLPENRHKLIPYTYFPFGTGPRNCLGMRFALMEVKLAISHIVMRYRFKRCPKTEVPIEYFNLTPMLTAKSITLGIEKR